MNIVFFGTPEFAAIVLEKLIQSEYKPVLVVTNPDEPVGRKQVLTPPPVKSCIMKHETCNIPVLQSEKLDSLFRLQVSGYEPDLFVVASYGKILPKELLDVPKYGAINVHPSLLPKYRGASPVQSAILNGDETTGVSIMLMDEEMDHGPILAQREFRISDVEFSTGAGKPTTPELKKELAKMGVELLLEIIPKWAEKTIEPMPQDHSKATYTKIITREDGEIDWSNSPERIERQIRAFTPWPGAYTFWKGKRLKILKAHIEGGKLAIDELQLEGKKPTSFHDFLLGHPNFTLC